MVKQFISHEQSLKLKKLGFKEECLGYYDGSGYPMIGFMKHGPISAPLWQQAFDFFREKYNFFSSPTEKDNDKTIEYDWVITKNLGDGKILINFVGYHKTYQEAQLACLDKLIEIVEQQNK